MSAATSAACTPPLSTPTAPDSWRRTVPDDAKFTQTRRTWLLQFLARERPRTGKRLHEVRMLVALAWCGGAAPLEELAVKAAVSRPSAKPDSARKQARRVIERLVAREIVQTRTLRLPYVACTHVDAARFPGEKGRLECQRLRQERKRGETCIAHHGYEIRTLVPDLTQGELRARLALAPDVITARVAFNRKEAEKERLEAGRQSNDAEGRKLRGLPTNRGPRGSNHTSPRYAKRRKPGSPDSQNVPPNPREGERDLEITASFDREGGDREDRPGSSAQPALSEGFAPAARVDGSWFGEPPPPCPAMGSARADDGGGSRTVPEATPRTTETRAPGNRERELPRLPPTGLSSPLALAGGGAAAAAGPGVGADVVRIAAARETRAIVDWFRAEWAMRKLPPLAEPNVAHDILWPRAKRFSRTDLAVALRLATRLAPKDGPKTFIRLFAAPDVLAERIDEEKLREERRGAKPRADVPLPLTFVSKGAPAIAPTAAKPTFGASMPAPAAWMSPALRSDALHAAEQAKLAAALGVASIYDVATSPAPVDVEAEKRRCIAKLRAELAALEGKSGSDAEKRARAKNRAKRRGDP